MGRKIGLGCGIEVAVDQNGFGIDPVCFGLTEPSMAHHQIEHGALALACAVQIDQRIEFRGLLRQTGQDGGLAVGQFVGGFTEVGQSRGLDTVSAMPKVDDVEVDLQQFIFGIERGEIAGQVVFHGFAFIALGKALVCIQKEMAGQLHGDRAGPGLDRIGRLVTLKGDQQAGIVNAPVLVEGCILGGDDGFPEKRRDLFERDPGSPALFVQFGDQLAPSIENRRGLEDARFGSRLVHAHVRFRDPVGMIGDAPVQVELGLVACAVFANLLRLLIPLIDRLIHQLQQIAGRPGDGHRTQIGGGRKRPALPDRAIQS